MSLQGLPAGHISKEQKASNSAACAMVVSTLCEDVALTVAQKLSRVVELRAHEADLSDSTFEENRNRILAGAGAKCAALSASGKTGESVEESTEATAAMFAEAKAALTTMTASEIADLTKAAATETERITTEIFEAEYSKGGCGCALFSHPHHGTLLISQVVPGGQSETLGVRAGDEIIAVNESESTGPLIFFCFFHEISSNAVL